MEAQIKLEELIKEGHEAKDKCLQEGLYGLHFISGPEYVTWIEKCKIFLKKSVNDEEIKSNFFDAAKQANGNGDSHFDQMIGILRALEEYEFEGKSRTGGKGNNKIDKIFISHSSKDVAYVDALVSLLNDIGIKKSSKHIFCSSLPGYDIPYGETIYDFLKKELNENIMVLFVLSHNYYGSAPSLNEMGAAWITSKQYNTILTPNFDFKKIEGAIDPTKISFHLNDEDGLNKFRDTMIKVFELSEIDYKIWNKDKKAFIEKVNVIAEGESLNLNTQVKIEKVKKIKDQEFELQLRFVNVTDKIIEFKYIDFELSDSNGNKSIHSATDEMLHDFVLYPKENKVVKWSFNYTSPYIPQRDDNDKTKIKFGIYS